MGNKKSAIWFATLLQNELNNNVARFTTHEKKTLQLLWLQVMLERSNVGGQTRDIATSIQLVLQQCCKRKCTFFCCPFYC